MAAAGMSPPGHASDVGTDGNRCAHAELALAGMMPLNHEWTRMNTNGKQALIGQLPPGTLTGALRFDPKTDLQRTFNRVTLWVADALPN